MQITISARHGHLGGSTQERITEKVQKLPRLFDRVTAVVVTVDVEHEDKPSVELRVSAEHTEDFVAKESAATVSAALDGALHKIEQQLRKHKERRTDRRTSGARHADVAEPAESDDTES